MLLVHLKIFLYFFRFFNNKRTEKIKFSKHRN